MIIYSYVDGLKVIYYGVYSFFDAWFIYKKLDSHE